MLKTIFILVFCMITLLSVFGQKPGSAGLQNPSFSAFIENGSILDTTANGRKLGRIPSPNLVLFGKDTEKSTYDLPESYDLREIENGNYLSLVRDQGKAGTCWAFGAYGSIESHWRKMGFGEVDFSEQHMATCHGFDLGIDDGGFPSMAFAYLARHSGAVSEADDPYTLPENNECKEYLTPSGLITEMRYLPGKQSYTYDEQLQNLIIDNSTFNPELIKNAIITYGAVDTDILWDDFYFNPKDNTYFYNGTGSTNHEILLVGWDDNKEITGCCLVKPKEKGAWIIRNSWGKYWGEDGYFYVSYEDTRVLSEIVIYPSAQKYDVMETVYQYDEIGMNDSYGYNSETVYGIVKFIAKKKISIASVGIPALSGNATLQAEIYSSFDGYSLSNQLGNTVIIDAPLPGSYNLYLDFPVTVDANSTFYIKVKCITPDNKCRLGTETYMQDFTSNVTIEHDKYWVSDTGINGSWYQLGNDSEQMYDLCIKAYGKYVSNSKESELELTNIETYNNDPNVTLYPNPCNGILTIESDDLQNCSATIITLAGKTIRSVILNSSVNQIEVNDLEAGIYIVQLSKNNELIRRLRLTVY